MRSYCNVRFNEPSEFIWVQGISYSYPQMGSGYDMLWMVHSQSASLFSVSRRGLCRNNTLFWNRITC